MSLTNNAPFSTIKGKKDWYERLADSSACDACFC